MDDGIAAETEAENTFRILIATDCHLGYAEKDPERGLDSLITFEEILATAQSSDVDFVLLAGDLFHENKPSRFCFHRCLSLLSRFTLGERPVQFEVLAAPDGVSVNHENSDINVALPVFSIHGNHDDPAGRGHLAALDTLEAARLISYFGKSDTTDDVIISPILLRKGTTKLALYGLGAIRDERLHRTFRERRVTMLRPKSGTDPKDQNEAEGPMDQEEERFFNILLLHQNRSKHSGTDYVAESFLDDFLDLVIWGHEHECRITPERSASRDFFVVQPGSSVATSLAAGEAVRKHVGILHVHGTQFRMEEIALQTVRPFVFRDLVLSDTELVNVSRNVSDRVTNYCAVVVDEMIRLAEEQRSGHVAQPLLPLIRLRVEYARDEETFSVARFGGCFVDRVANPRDLVLFHKRKSVAATEDVKNLRKNVLKANEADLVRFGPIELVRRHFESLSAARERLELLTESGLGRAVTEYVEKSETEAIAELVSHQLQRTRDYLGTHVPPLKPDDDIEAVIARFKAERCATAQEEQEVVTVLDAARRKRIDLGTASDDDYAAETLSEDDAAPTTSARGRRGSRGRRATRSRAATPRGRRVTESFFATKRKNSDDDF